MILVWRVLSLESGDMSVVGGGEVWGCFIGEVGFGVFLVVGCVVDGCWCLEG